MTTSIEHDGLGRQVFDKVVNHAAAPSDVVADLSFLEMSDATDLLYEDGDYSPAQRIRLRGLGIQIFTEALERHALGLIPIAECEQAHTDYLDVMLDAGKWLARHQPGQQG
ncbi:MAG TPA: hypothetical protein VLF90_03570 [Patescibacteria group bacterium]|nr:hypothetical protein [Patescibacteria group bacterium]